MNFHPAEWVASAQPFWKRGRLKDLVLRSVNGTWGTDVSGDEGVRCVRATDFDRRHRRVQLDRAPFRHVDVQSLKQHQLKSGDLVLEKSGGGDKQPVGMVVLFTGNEPAVCSNFCARIVPAREVDSQFLNYVFAATYSMGLTKSSIKQTTGIQNLDTGALFDNDWAWPPLEEQRRIADFLDAETTRIDKIISIRQRQLVIFQERQQAIVDHFLIQEGEPMVNLARLCRVQSGVTVNGGRSSENAELRPYLRVANVQADGLDLSEVKEILVDPISARRFELRPGDVLMTEGGDLDKLGRGTVWSGEISGCLHQNHVFAVRPNSRLSGEYLALLTRTSLARSYFEMTGSKTTNLASTSSGKILAFRIPLLELDEQLRRTKETEQELSQTAAIATPMAKQVDLLSERRQALITAAVTGQFDVSSASGRGIEE